MSADASSYAASIAASGTGSVRAARIAYARTTGSRSVSASARKSVCRPTSAANTASRRS